jgi:arylsulfatase
MPDRVLITHVGRWPKDGKPETREEWKYKGCSVRNTRWHLVSADGGREPKWQLFNVQADPGEQTDVAQANTEMVASLARSFDSWWQDVQPMLLNEKAVGPRVNPFKEIYWKQFGGGPMPELLEEMNPARRLETKPAAKIVGVR